TAPFVDEVRQLLRARLFVGEGSRGKIADYSGRGPLDSWVRACALRIALDVRRRDVREERLPDDNSDHGLISPGSDPELDYIKARYREPFEAAFTEALGALDAQQRNVLRYYFVDGLTLEKIGALYSVNRSTILRWIGASQRRLMQGMRRRLRE